MITTIDNVECKRWSKVWELGIDADTKRYAPTLSVVNGVKNSLSNPERCWKNYDLAKEEAKKLNQILNPQRVIKPS